jgi:hypothetical protein
MTVIKQNKITFGEEVEKLETLGTVGMNKMTLML